MKSVVACVCSALLGGLFAVWMMERSPHASAQAQPARQPGGPGVSSFRASASSRTQGPLQCRRIDARKKQPTFRSTRKSIAASSTSRRNQWMASCSLRASPRAPVPAASSTRRGTFSRTITSSRTRRSAGVTLHNGKTYEASLVGADPINDIAVLKIAAPREQLVPVALGNSGRLKVGMRVYAIGNPFGLERTMTTGIISSLNRSLKVRGGRTIRSIIQIDAAVNPGNSGGPLLDTHGRVIGINTAIATRTGQSSGVGFAIPANLIRRVVPQLIKHGRVIRPEIGIRRVYETERGLLIAALSPDGPAAKAGLRGPKVTRSRQGLFIVERIEPQCGRHHHRHRRSANQDRR